MACSKSAAPMPLHGFGPTAASSGSGATAVPMATGAVDGSADLHRKPVDEGADLHREVTLVLPYPVSANVYWRSFVPKGHKRPVTIPSEEAREYRNAVAVMVREQGITAPIRGRVHVHIDLYPQRPLDWAKRQRKLGDGWDDSVRCIDLDNARKVLYDSLKGVAMEDDAMVWRDSGERKEPDGNARVVVTIRPMVRVKAQAELIA